MITPGELDHSISWDPKNPTMIPCWCGTMVAAWYSPFVQSYTLRHGDGEAMREFASSEILHQQHRRWLHDVHGYERDEPGVHADEMRGVATRTRQALR